MWNMPDFYISHLGPLLLIKSTSSHLLKDVANDTPLCYENFVGFISLPDVHASPIKSFFAQIFCI